MSDYDVIGVAKAIRRNCEAGIPMEDIHRVYVEELDIPEDVFFLAWRAAEILQAPTDHYKPFDRD